MFPPKGSSLKSVTKNLRNLPDPSVDPTPAQEPDADDMTCPSCGAPFSLKAVAKPSTAPPQADTDIPAAAQADSNTGPGF